MNRKFEFKVQSEVLDIGVKIKGVRIQGINNTVYSSWYIVIDPSK